MQAALPQSRHRGLWRILSPRRVVFTLLACALGGLVVSPIWVIPAVEVMARAMLVGLVALVVFGGFEHWPAELTGWLARWVLQVMAVVVAIPMAVLALYLTITIGDELPFWRSEARLSGFLVLSFTGVLLASYMAMTALLRQRD